MQINLIEQLSGYIAWKDHNLRYLGCNSRFAKALRVNNSKEIVGLTDKDIITSLDESLSFYEESDKLALGGSISGLEDTS